MSELIPGKDPGNNSKGISGLASSSSLMGGTSGNTITSRHKKSQAESFGSAHNGDADESSSGQHPHGGNLSESDSETSTRGDGLTAEPVQASLFSDIDSDVLRAGESESQSYLDEGRQTHHSDNILSIELNPTSPAMATGIATAGKLKQHGSQRETGIRDREHVDKTNLAHLQKLVRELVKEEKEEIINESVRRSQRRGGEGRRRNRKSAHKTPQE